MIKYTFDKTGRYTITADYIGSELYQAIIVSLSIEINKIPNPKPNHKNTSNHIKTNANMKINRGLPIIAIILVSLAA
ncbi:hypothetical protein ALNOE001_11830 [Candidatus Methanobinarius endosymbioticus]|uniref:Uncharacterized protein n=1 Tax=Candidatus Methanobinarius endosymbioticus TaxID=2006182 RepID=A0A366MBK5_9EURY|nr:hypothetical protein ALNOE001_11830 [Candidatus Methanobinarius endosymbioticus]